MITNWRRELVEVRGMEMSLVMMRSFGQMLGKSRNVYHCTHFIHDFPAVSILIRLGKEARKNHGVTELSDAY